MNSTRISSSLRAVSPGPRKNSSRGRTLSPSDPFILTEAPKTRRGGAVSAEGAALQIFPPMVATFLIWTEPRLSTASARAPSRSLTRGDFSSSLWVVRAPILRPPSSSLM